jgi:hypothetical protein
VGTTLAGRENSIVDTLLEILSLLTVLAEEDEAGTRAAEGLVSRRGDNVTVLEGIRELAGRDETRSVGDVGHEEGTVLVCDLAEGGIVPITRVRRGTTDDEPGLEDLGLLSEG